MNATPARPVDPYRFPAWSGEFLLNVAAERDPYWGHTHKFGVNTDVDAGAAEHVWAQGGTYTYPSDAGITAAISSSSTSDTHEITIEGLDENFHEVVISATLTGQSKLELPGLWTRIYRVHNTSSVASVGKVYVYDTTDTVALGIPQTQAKIHSTYLPKYQQSMQAMWTVPSVDRQGKVVKFALLVQYGATMNNDTPGVSASIPVDLQTREFGKVFIEHGAFGLQSSGDSVISTVPRLALMMHPREDIQILCGPGTHNDVDVSAWFDVIFYIGD